MRIVGGQYKGKKLISPTDDRVRPTSDRAREALFNILTQGKWGDVIQGASIVDLFCGSGAVGLEALSRGSDEILFVDSNLKSVSNNLDLFEKGRFRCLQTTVEALPKAPQAYDVIFADPPYNKDLIPITLKKIADGGWLAKKGLLIIESDKPFNADHFTIVDQRKYGKSQFVFLQS